MGGMGSLRSVPRPIAAGALVVLGGAFAAAHVRHVLQHESSVFGIVLGGMIPLGLALGLAVAGGVLYSSQLDNTAVTTTAAWGYIGALVLTCVSLLIIGHQADKGQPLHGPGYMAVTAATGGALVGTVAGRYEAMNRQKADLIVSVQEATATLSAATTTEEVSQSAVRIASEVLGIPLTGIWLYDPDEEALVPAAIADPAELVFDSPPVYRSGEGPLWEALETGQTEWYDDVSRTDGRHNRGTVIRSEMVVPMGETGVMNFGSRDPDRFGPLDETVAELLATTTEAALVRADREEQLREQRRRLSQQNERLEEFTSVVSHDLRNPLNVASGRLELARTDGDEVDLEAVSDALEDMERLIDDLLSLAKQGRSVGATERVSLAAVTGAASECLEDGSATLDVEDLELEADPDRLRQLVENLLVNAVTHGEPPVAVRVGPLSDGNGFFLADDGPGIDLDERDRVFETGYTDHEDGTGFGLAIVRRIAAAHGWAVSLTESESGGARFEFRFDDVDCPEI